MIQSFSLNINVDLEITQKNVYMYHKNVSQLQPRAIEQVNDNASKYQSLNKSALTWPT